MNDKEFEKLVFGMAHQIRNPCAIIKANANVLLEKERLSPEARRSMESILNGVNYLEQRLDEFVEFSKPLVLKFGTLSVQTLFKHAAGMFREQCELKKIKISCTVEKDLILKKADSNQMALALLNVVLNSVESIRERGSVTLEAHSEGDHAMLTVTDSGSGIHPRDLPEVFSPFYSTKPNSIGIGLAVAKMIVHGHKGTIGVQSILGEGTVVTMKIPIQPA